jgi:hypothetical protein
MLIAQLLLIPFRQTLNRIMTTSHRLIAMACDPYRPELYYMRGPGPKWHAKHAQLFKHAQLVQHAQLIARDTL